MTVVAPPRGGVGWGGVFSVWLLSLFLCSDVSLLLFSSFLMLLPFCARTDNSTYSFDVLLCRGNLVFWALIMCFSWSVACNPHSMKLHPINLLFNLIVFKCFLVAWPLLGTLPTKAPYDYDILRFISWLVHSCGGWFLACPWPPPSTCCSSFIIEEVPGGHMASCFSLMLSACFVDVNGEHSPSQWVFFFFILFHFFPWERWSCLVQRNAAGKVCLHEPPCHLHLEPIVAFSSCKSSISWTNFEQLLASSVTNAKFGFPHFVNPILLIQSSDIF